MSDTDPYELVTYIPLSTCESTFLESIEQTLAGPTQVIVIGFPENDPLSESELEQIAAGIKTARLRGKATFGILEKLFSNSPIDLTPSKESSAKGYPLFSPLAGLIPLQGYPFTIRNQTDLAREIMEKIGTEFQIHIQVSIPEEKMKEYIFGTLQDIWSGEGGQKQKIRTAIEMLSTSSYYNEIVRATLEKVIEPQIPQPEKTDVKDESRIPYSIFGDISFEKGYFFIHKNGYSSTYSSPIESAIGKTLCYLLQHIGETIPEEELQRVSGIKSAIKTAGHLSNLLDYSFYFRIKTYWSTKQPRCARLEVRQEYLDRIALEEQERKTVQAPTE